MRSPRYSLGSIALHWLHAVLIVTLIYLGLSIDSLPNGPERSSTIALHKSFGVLAFLLVIVRLLWRHSNPGPQDARFSALQQRLAHAGHHTLYLLLVLTPLAGYLSSSFTKYPMRVFGYAIPKLGWEDDRINAFFNAAHSLCAWLLIALICGHIAVVVLHHLQGRPVLYRMLPGKSASSRSPSDL